MIFDIILYTHLKNVGKISMITLITAVAPVDSIAMKMATTPTINFDVVDQYKIKLVTTPAK